jgi:hypothetical protein
VVLGGMLLVWAVCHTLTLPHSLSVSLSHRRHTLTLPILQPRAKKSSRPPSTCRSLHLPSRCDNNNCRATLTPPRASIDRMRAYAQHRHIHY